MEKRKKQKDEENSSKLTSPFAGTAFRGSAETYLQNSSSGFPFSNSQIWRWAFHLYLMWTSQLTNWHLVQNAECALPRYRGDDTSQNFQSQLDSAQDEPKCCCPESVFLLAKQDFQNKDFISKTESQGHIFFSNQENDLYMHLVNLFRNFESKFMNC